MCVYVSVLANYESRGGGLLFIFIQLLSANEMLSKVVVSVITVVSNYGLCKFKIFAAKGGHEYGQN